MLGQILGKSILKARPVYVHNEDSIEAHFLSCFVSLLILRLLEQKTDYKIPIRTMVDSLRKANLSKQANDTYQNTYCDNILSVLGKTLDLDLTKKYYSANDLKKLRGKTQKTY